MRKTKGELMEHYAYKKPQGFIQYDAFDIGVDGGDSVMHPDKDGHTLFGTATCELMSGSSVRVFIHPDTKRKDAVQLLKKIAAWIKRDKQVFEEHRRLTREPEQKGIESKCSIPF